VTLHGPAAVLLAVVAAGCVNPAAPPQLQATLVDSSFDVANHMAAGLEMQLSGEPFAQLLGYNLAGFGRTFKVTDLYLDPATQTYRTDPLGYALAVESYEYSKQPMNNVSFESGAGLSLMFGPVLNSGQVTGDAAYSLLLTRFQQLAGEAMATTPSGGPVASPAPTENPLNFYGWPGLWPVFAEFSRFDSWIDPAPGRVLTCSLGQGNVGALTYGGVPPSDASPSVANYECDYNSLNLPERETQVTKTLEPDALGYAAWKQALWTLNYWQTMQDANGDGIVALQDPTQSALVGQPGNTVVGLFPNPDGGQDLLPGTPGTYLGDIPIEGWQGLTLLEEMDNKSALLLQTLLSADGSSLTGMPSVAAALSYSYDSPLVYFPASIGVAETPTTADPSLADKYFPQPTLYSVADGASRLSALNGLIGGFGEVFALTDGNNSQAGGSPPFLATFDGDPFPADDGQPDGENTLHDRALGILKVSLVDLDRLHFNAANRVLVDEASPADATVVQGTQVTTLTLAQSIVALRNAYRSLTSSLQLYSNDTPDTLQGPSALDNAPLGGAPFPGTLADHITQLIQYQADFLSQRLVNSTGGVFNGIDLATGQVDASPTSFESEASAIRALLDAYLATSTESYRDVATTIYADLNQRFWMEDVRCFQTTQGNAGLMQFTPIRFGMLTGALRQYYKLVASRPGREAEAQTLLAHLKRMHKLVLNGWDDRNEDDHVQYPDECLGAGLELGERALTGELGHAVDLGDRDHDCVWEISYVHRPAALGVELDLARL
jgi:hypothetical protein